jgi:hypothetical protein
MNTHAPDHQIIAPFNANSSQRKTANPSDLEKNLIMEIHELKQINTSLELKVELRNSKLLEIISTNGKFQEAYYYGVSFLKLFRLMVNFFQ